MKKNILLLIFGLYFSWPVWAQKTHTVKQGETLKSIATLYNTTESEIKKANPNVELVFSGLLLNIPQSGKKMPKPNVSEQTSIKTDKVIMKDGSYILCKVRSIKQGIITIKQEKDNEIYTIPSKEVSLIEYINGTKKRFK